MIDELNDILSFWLDFGVDGFRVDAIGYSLEHEDFRDEPLIDSTELGKILIIFYY